MKYISPEELLKQSERVRENILHLWTPEEGDICYHVIDRYKFICSKYYPDYNETYKDKDLIEYNNFPEYKAYYRKNCIPVLTEGSLRKIIGGHFGLCCKVELEWCNNGYKVNIVSGINDEKVYAEFPTSESEPIRAYWNVVVRLMS